ncbi:histidine kinase [Eubacteriales bacterium OttesenSCG-928-A19]|nr:histidine kinase [Eubacteriales bacterium OttesenSCG-928-A19]
MRSAMRGRPIRRLFYGIMGLFSVFFISVILIFYSLYTSAIRDNARTFNDVFTTQSIQLVNRYIVETNAMMDSLLFHQDVLSFYREMDSTERIYQNHARVSALILEQLPYTEFVSSVILFVQDGSFYRHLQMLSNEECYYIRDQVDMGRRDKRIITLDGRRYLCAIEPVYDISTMKVSDQSLAPPLGTIVILSNLNSARKLHSLYGNLDSFFISLLDQDDMIVMSNRPEWEGMPIDALEREKMLIVRQRIPGASISLAAAMLPDAHTGGWRIARYVPLLLSILLILLLLMAYAIRAAVLRPIERLTANIQTLDTNAEGARLPMVQSGDIDIVVLNMNGLLERIEQDNQHILQTQRLLYEAQSKEAESRLQLLKKQINVHFLYNALNSIQALLHANENDKATRVSEGLSALLHYAYDGEKYVGTLDELEAVDQYITIMNIRFQDRFSVTYAFDDELADYSILRLLIQPLVENAITHGLEGTRERGELRVSGSLSPDRDTLCFTIEDNGVGIPPEKLEAIRRDLGNLESHSWGLGGIALNNINRRIKLTYGDAYGLAIDSRPGMGTRVTVTLPARP